MNNTSRLYLEATTVKTIRFKAKRTSPWLVGKADIDFSFSWLLPEALSLPLQLTAQHKQGRRPTASRAPPWCSQTQGQLRQTAIILVVTCKSFCGFQSESNMMQVSAAVRLMPRPPALVHRRKTKRSESGLQNRSMAAWRRFPRTRPSIRS